MQLNHPHDWLNKREKHYRKFLGKTSGKVFHDTTLTSPHIDIYEVPPDPKTGRDFYTLITSGMSNLLQTLPKTVTPEEAGRAEILWYVKEPETWMYDFLLVIAKAPFEIGSFFF